MNQPVIGSLAWMTYTMASVYPVYDNVTVLTPEDPHFAALTDEAGNILVSDTVPPLGNLVRWI